MVLCSVKKKHRDFTLLCMSHIGVIITAVDVSIFWLHHKLLIQSYSQQVALTCPKNIVMCKLELYFLFI